MNLFSFFLNYTECDLFVDLQKVPLNQRLSSRKDDFHIHKPTAALGG